MAVCYPNNLTCASDGLNICQGRGQFTCFAGTTACNSSVPSWYCPVSLSASSAFCYLSAADCRASSLNQCSALSTPCTVEPTICSGAANGYNYYCPPSPPPPQPPQPPLPPGTFPSPFFNASNRAVTPAVPSGAYFRHTTAADRRSLFFFSGLLFFYLSHFSFSL